MNGRELTPGTREHELLATVALLQAPQVVKAHLGAQIDGYGSAVELLRWVYRDASAEESTALFETVPESVLSQAEQEVQSWGEHALTACTVLDSTYPELLRSIFNRPPLLFVRGERSAVESVGVAIVGTREPSEAGARRARKLARELGKRGLTIVSGLAKGIDTAAHTGALEVGGRTVAVVGTGLDHTYPKENTLLARQIVDCGGALVSQFFPKQPPMPGNFPTRNITMSGLSVLTVVVEASETSGARMQARVALEHGRTVFLLRSLVNSHVWAQRMVEEGVKGTRASVLEEVDDVTRRLDPEYEPQAFATA